MNSIYLEEEYKWSRYNRLFKSDKIGYLLYNSLTNSFARLDEDTYREIKEIQKNPTEYDFSNNPALYLQLLQAKLLVKEDEEEDIINQRQLSRLYNQYNTDHLSLTIAPTTACNFKCPYCYEQIKETKYMDKETEVKLITFIKRFFPLSGLSITWYGGEPLLDFEIINRITQNILNMGIPYQANMTTNGYLLNEKVIKKLNDLKIRLLQVTVDGGEETHNSRRFLVNGKGTYNKIINNLKKLMESDWNGILKVRVNVDKSNQLEFVEVYKELSRKFNSKRVNIYPGIVSDLDEGNHDLSCNLNREEEMEFYLELYRKYGISVHEFYPQKSDRGCAATSRNAFVIGPMGEVYKCWNDLGNEKMVIGNIDDKERWNKKLLTRYMIGTDHYNNEECQECFYLPVCDGGCPKIRYLNKYENQDRNYCVDYKNNLEEMLEIYYSVKQTEKG